MTSAGNPSIPAPNPAAKLPGARPSRAALGILVLVGAIGGATLMSLWPWALFPPVNPLSSTLGRSPTCSGSELDEITATWIPERRVDASTGSAFAERTAGWRGRDRQREALRELREGNIPEFLRHLKPVHLSYTTHGGRTIHAVVWVTPDYLSIGSDADYLRIPLTRPSAVTIARELGFVLPTRKLVDAINEQAEFHFTPRPLPPGKMMRSSEYYRLHNELIEKQRKGRRLGELVSGHKKDVVLTNRLLGPERLAIYGWHRKNGEPIQCLSMVHGAQYADYSHGVRLVYSEVCVDGELRSIYEVLEDKTLAPVLSYEGLLPRIRKLMRWKADA